MPLSTTDRLKTLTDPALINVLEALLEEIRMLRTGFPGDDPVGHRNWHEAETRLMQKRADRIEAITETLFKGSAWTILAAAVLAAIDYFKIKVGLK